MSKRSLNGAHPFDLEAVKMWLGYLAVLAMRSNTISSWGKDLRWEGWWTFATRGYETVSSPPMRQSKFTLSS